MEFYKKNPEIEGDITVQGKLVSDDTVVCGDEFKPFADPGTFPGIPVRLVKVEFKNLSSQEQEQVQDLIAEQKGMPPRHLGVIKSDTFTSSGGGNVKVLDTAAVTPSAPKAKVIPIALPPEPEKKKVVAPDKPKPKLVSEMFTHSSFAEEFPGVTEKNAKKALKGTTTLEALSTATNAELRKMGINPSFYGRLREKALELMEQED